MSFQLSAVSALQAAVGTNEMFLAAGSQALCLIEEAGLLGVSGSGVAVVSGSWMQL